jgi:molybdopterin-biosynthesis enzyme MoeA-like protein
MSEKTPKVVTAAILVIGNEILSGRTKDANLHYLATGLTAIGIRLMEARVVPDIEARIIEAVNALRAGHNYVFTTGASGRPMTTSPRNPSPMPSA